MNNDIAVSVNHISKRYLLYSRPRDRLMQMLLGRFGRNYAREFWALRDISFEMRHGETLAIIGQNGSGKSTLLQIITGTLQPTKGQVQVRGRVAALLELGAGFNPEFTGRENVFLNGAILGISKREMRKRFDAIAEFADIGEFMEQPVKVYSSGMYVRLAFAVASNVEPDILVVDEVLAVGDMFFQAKCIARMKKLLNDGVTVLFVSHDVGAVKSLCRRAILLDHGRMLDDDVTDRVAEKYFALKVRGEQAVVAVPSETPPLEQSGDAGRASTEQGAFNASAEFQKRASFERIRNGKAHFANLMLLNERSKEITVVEYDQVVTLRMAIQICEDVPLLGVAYHIRDRNGVDIVYSDSAIENKWISPARKGARYIVDWTFNAALAQGNYNIAAVISIPIDLSIGQVDFCDFVPLAVQFSVASRLGSPLYGLAHLKNRVELRSL